MTEIVLCIGFVRLFAIFFLLLAAPFGIFALGWLIAIFAKKAYNATSAVAVRLVWPWQEG